MTDKKQNIFRRPAVLMMLIVLVSLGAGFSVGFFEEENPDLGTMIFAALMIVLLPICCYYWRRLDETAREAHKFAWYWGSSVAILGIVVVYAIALFGVGAAGEMPSFYASSKVPEDAFVDGAIFVFMSQVVAYGVLWIVWWVRMR